jgi:hypothetical protein
MILAFSVGAEESQDPSHRELVKSDLFAVISLSGLHCETVVDYEKIGGMDYIAICKNGSRYRINVTPDGRVETDVHEAQ